VESQSVANCPQKQLCALFVYVQNVLSAKTPPNKACSRLLKPARLIVTFITRRFCPIFFVRIAVSGFTAGKANR
jgi:hypothetical protein